MFDEERGGADWGVVFRYRDTIAPMTMQFSFSGHYWLASSFLVREPVAERERMVGRWDELNKAPQGIIKE